MGIGIWSMHFTGILAFSLPVPVSYYWTNRSGIASGRRLGLSPNTACRKP
jgi:Bacterial signalling protein N terminal repeat